MRWTFLASLPLAAQLACANDVDSPRVEDRKLGEFVGMISATGEWTVVPSNRVAELGEEASGLWGKLQTEQNGVRGRGRAGTVEVSTIPGTAGFGAPRCAANEVCGQVQIGSRIDTPVTNLTAHIERVYPPTGVMPVEGTETAPFMGLDATRGLFVYRETVPAWTSGMAQFTQAKQWSFRRISGGNVFVFGSVYGDVGAVDRCGDGIIAESEACDPQAQPAGCGEGLSCNADCVCTSICGNGAIDMGEACDDGNQVGGDGCRADCTIERCGDGIIDPNESCDDMNTDPNDGCNNQCIKVDRIIDDNGVPRNIENGPPGVPSEVGCADGQREGLIDASMYPTIAGCLGRWPTAASLRALSETPVTCGDDSSLCTMPSELCAPGWHLCAADGGMDEVLQLGPTECENAGGGTYVFGVSHCLTQSGCVYDAQPSATYPCFATGWCSEPICCGAACRGFGACPSGAWPSKTHIPVGTDQGCGAITSARAGGVFCCADVAQ